MMQKKKKKEIKKPHKKIKKSWALEGLPWGRGWQGEQEAELSCRTQCFACKSKASSYRR